MYFTAQQRGCVLVKTLNSRNEITALWKACEVINDILGRDEINPEGMDVDSIRDILAEFEVSIVSHKNHIDCLRITN